MSLIFSFGDIHETQYIIQLMIYRQCTIYGFYIVSISKYFYIRLNFSFIMIMKKRNNKRLKTL